MIVDPFDRPRESPLLLSPASPLSPTVYQPLGLPGKPTQVGILGMGSGAVKLQWEAPGSDGGATIKMFRITLTPVSGDIKNRLESKPIVVECTADGPDPQCESEFIVQGLKDGIQYSVNIAAKNKFGWGKNSIDPVLVTTEPTAGQPPAQILRGFKNKKGAKRGLDVE